MADPGHPSTVTLISTQRLFLELADLVSLVSDLQRKRAITSEQAQSIRNRDNLRDQSKELVRQICSNLPHSYEQLLLSLEDSPNHRCLKENLIICYRLIERSPVLNIPEKKDIQIKIWVTRRNQRSLAPDVVRLMTLVEEGLRRIHRGSAREVLLIDYGLLVKSLEVQLDMLVCQLQVNAKYSHIIEDVEDGTMAQKMWSKLTQNSVEMGNFSDWLLNLQLPQVDKNQLTSLSIRLDEDEEGFVAHSASSHSLQSPTSSLHGTPSSLESSPFLIPQSDLPEAHRIVWRLLLSQITNKGSYLSQFLRLMRQCLPKADLKTLASDDGFSLLHEVIRNKRADLIESFQYCGVLLAMYNQPVASRGTEYSGLTPVDLTDRFAASKERQEMEKNMRIERNIQRYPIRIACRDGKVQQFKKLLKNDYFIGSANDNKSCLDWAIVSGSLEMLNAVMEAERSRGHQREDGADQVILCVTLGHSVLLEPLLNYLHVELNDINVDGKSLMEKTAEFGDIEMFGVLKSRGATIPDTLLAIASTCGRQDFVLECISSHCPPLDVNFRDRRQKAALHFATERGHANVIELLVSKGADVTVRDKRQRSILHAAAENGNVEMLVTVIRLLQDSGKLQELLSSPDKYLGSELCFLVRGRDQEMPAWHYVHVDRGVLDIFRIKTRGGAVDVAQYGYVIRSGWGANPSQDVISEVESRYDMANIAPNAEDDMLPAHLAIVKNNTDSACLMIEHMPESLINEPDKFGLTLLHYACMRGDIKVITVLDRKHANRTAVDGKGRTPAQLAQINNHPQVIEFFRSDNLFSSVDEIETDYKIFITDEN